MSCSKGINYVGLTMICFGVSGAIGSSRKLKIKSSDHNDQI